MNGNPRYGVIDLNCLFALPIAGVAGIVRAHLPFFIREMKAKGLVPVFYHSGLEMKAVPAWLAALAEREGARLCRVPLPNKLLSLLSTIGIGPRYERVVEFFMNVPRGSVAAWLLTDPAPWRSRASGETWVLVHDLGLLWYPKLAPRAWPAKFRWMTRRSQRRGVSRWFAVSSSTAAQIPLAWPDAAGKVTVLPEPPLALPRAEGECPERLASLAGAPFVLFLSTVSPRKNLEGLVAAWQLLLKEGNGTSARLVVAGDCGWGSEGVLKVLESGRVAQAAYYGRVTDEERAWLVANAAVMAYPSVYEGLGMPPREAQLAGTPALVADMRALVETSGAAALVAEPDNVASIAAALESALYDRAYWKSKTDAARV